MTRGQDGPHPVDIHVGRRVAERRLALGHSQTHLSQAIGVTFQQVQKYEKGANRISASKLWDVSRFLGVEIGYFFEGLPDQPAATGPAADLGPIQPTTRQAVEIAQRAPQLSVRHQRLTLNLMRQLMGEDVVASS